MLYPKTLLLEILYPNHKFLRIVTWLIIFAVLLKNVLNTSRRNVFKTSWRYLDVFAKRLEDFLKRQIIKIIYSCRCFSKTSWKRLEGKSLKWMYSCWLIHLEDVFWRHMTKANILVLMNKLEHKDESCLQDVFRTSSSRRMFAGLLLTFC